MSRLSLLTRTALAAGFAAAAGGAAPAFAADSRVPYADPAQNGFIGLCDASGHAITSGSLSSIPFVWRAVSTTAAYPPIYGGIDRSATLFAVTPRQGVPPGQWTGEQVTFTSRYTNPQHPMVSGDRRDRSLREYVDDAPPRWDGLVQLRMYLSRPGYAAYTQRYAATDIRITGNTWTVVRGATSNACGTGGAKSAAAFLKLPTYRTKGAPPAPAPARNITAAAAVAGGPAATTDGTGPAGPVLAANASDGRSPDGGLWVTPLVIGLAGAAAIGGGSVAVRRLRSPSALPAEHPNGQRGNR